MSYPTFRSLKLVPLTAAMALSSAPAWAADSAPLPAIPFAPPQQTFVAIADRLMPSVVNILTTKKMRSHPWRQPGGPDDFWNRFFDEPGPGTPRSTPQPMSLGSGFVIEASKEGSSGSGLIVTNHHVIAGADEVQVKFTENDDEKPTVAEVIGRDPDLDVALLRIKTDRKLVAVALGDSEKLKVGEWIAALGNPFGHGHSMSHGIVSAKARTLPGSFGRFLQVDAPINPGNSGGPLVDAQGAVIGINNAIDARGPGIGFAIPINSVKAILADLKSKGKVERGYIGANIGRLTPELAQQLRVASDTQGPVVIQVVPGSPAYRAGLQAYDVIVEIEGQPVRSPDQLVEKVVSTPVGGKLAFKAIRNGKLVELKVTPAVRGSQES